MIRYWILKLCILWELLNHSSCPRIMKGFKNNMNASTWACAPTHVEGHKDFLYMEFYRDLIDLTVALKCTILHPCKLIMSYILNIFWNPCITNRYDFLHFYNPPQNPHPKKERKENTTTQKKHPNPQRKKGRTDIRGKDTIERTSYSVWCILLPSEHFPLKGPAMEDSVTLKS